MDLIDVAAKVHVPFFNSFWAQGDRSGSLTTEAQCVGLAISQDEPLHIRVISRTSEYLRNFLTNWSYMKAHRQDETGRAFKRRVYDTLRTVYCGG